MGLTGIAAALPLALATGAGPSAAGQTDTSWPPALVYFAVGLMLVALFAAGTIFWRARRTIHPKD